MDSAQRASVHRERAWRVHRERACTESVRGECTESERARRAHVENVHGESMHGESTHRGCARSDCARSERARREHAQRACTERACTAGAHLPAALAKVQTLPRRGEIRGLPLRRPQPSHLSGGFACHTSREAALIRSHAKGTYARTGVGGEYNYTTCSAAPAQLREAFSCGTAAQSPGGADRGAGAV